MIAWEETESGLRAFDSAKVEISVDAPDWRTGGPDRDIPRSVDATVSGSASELRFPPAFVYVMSLRGERTDELGSDIGPISLPADQYLVNVHGSIALYVRFEGPATIRKTADYDTVILSFPDRTAVTFGFKSRLRLPEQTLTVPGTPAGLATALTHLSSCHEMSGPNRSYHSFRGHPPLIELGDDYDIPTEVRRETPETGIELRCPPSIETLFLVAPLAYYLQADVRIADRETPRLRAPAAGVDHELRAAPALQHDAADLLRRTFHLDCLVRNAGRNEAEPSEATELSEARLLEDVGIDAVRTARQPPAERLRTYLAAPFAEIRDDLPDWHLSMYVKPSVDHVPCLPFLLDNLALIYRPGTSELAGKELMKHSLDDFYRGPRRRGARRPGRGFGQGPVRSIDAVKPTLQHGRVHGWLADGTPIDVFKTLPQAYENRLKYFDRESTATTVTVVLNDAGMQSEHSAVADIYEERSGDLPLDVTVRDRLTRRELASVFETPTDFVHYIGHCETDGLRCSDGNLSISDIEESNAQTFFLNACGSYHEGLSLVEKGSVAGAVTFKKVLNEQAAKVGTAFARLLINGFSLERAMRLSRRRIMMGKDYAVVGDGTHVLTQCDNYLPLSATLEARADGRFELTMEMFSARKNGGYYQPYILDNEQSYLYGTESEFTLDREQLRSFLGRAKMPVVYNGDFYWSQELVDELSD